MHDEPGPLLEYDADPVDTMRPRILGWKRVSARGD